FPKSRGDIVTSYLLNQNEPVAFLKDLQAERHLYGGFNLIVGHVDSLYYYSPQHNEIEAIQPGIHSLSNADLNTPWPKVLRAKEKLAQTKTTSNQDVLQALLLQLSDKKKAAAQDLPETGVGLALEKELSPIFIKT